MSAWVLGGAAQGLGAGMARFGEMTGQNYFAMARDAAAAERDKNLARFRKELDLEYADQEGAAAAKRAGLVAGAQAEATEPYTTATEERAEARQMGREDREAVREGEKRHYEEGKAISAEERAERRKIAGEEREAKRPKLTTVGKGSRVVIQRGDEVTELVLDPSNEGLPNIRFGAAPPNMEQKDWLAVQKFWRQQAKESYGTALAEGIMLDEEAKIWAARTATQAEEIFKADPRMSALRAFEMALDRQEAQVGRVSKARAEGVPRRGLFGMGSIDTQQVMSDLATQYPRGARNTAEVMEYLSARGMTDPGEQRRIAEEFMSGPMVAGGQPPPPAGGLVRDAIGAAPPAPAQPPPAQAPQGQQPQQEIDLLSDDPLGLF